MMILGFLPQNLKTQAVAVAFSIAWPGGTVEPGPGEDQARDRLAVFRRELYGCLTVLAELSLAPGHRRGHGALYDAVNCGRADVARLRWSLAALPLPAWEDGRIRLAADVSNCGRTRSPARSACSATATGGGRTARR